MRECDVWEDGEHVLTLSSAMGETRREARRFYAYSVLKGELVKTLVDTRGEYYAWNVPAGASFELGTHRVADELRDLEVQNFAIAGLFAFSTRSRLHLAGRQSPVAAAIAAATARGFERACERDTAMRRHVIVLGGGVGGMSAAHELIERGFRVTVYEKGDMPGGKARSFGVPGTGTNGRRDLPAEHGFRFFPGFYRHLPDTMTRIPYVRHRSVFDNLVDTTEMQILFQGRRHLVVPARFPRLLERHRRRSQRLGLSHHAGRPHTRRHTAVYSRASMAS